MASRKSKPIFVAATGQHVGKTTTTLGLLNSLKSKGYNVGYCKPVGQQSIEIKGERIDKDTVLFTDFMEHEIEPHIHSPVLIGQGATSTYLANPDPKPNQRKLLKASKILYSRHDIVVYEGTGHPGVGSVVDLSNADVAKLLKASVVMVVEGGIGNTIDRLMLSISMFRQKKVPILGVVINKTIPEKIDTVRELVGSKLKREKLQLLGVMPYDEELGYPLMSTIVESIGGEVMYNKISLFNRVRDIIAGSLVEVNQLKDLSDQLLVVSFSRLGEALKRIQFMAKKSGTAISPLSGIILTGEGELNESQIDYIKKHKIPVIRSRMDTYESVIKISRIEVKINTKTPWKVTKAINLFKRNIDMDLMLKRL